MDDEERLGDRFGEVGRVVRAQQFVPCRNRGRIGLLEGGEVDAGCGLGEVARAVGVDVGDEFETSRCEHRIEGCLGVAIGGIETGGGHRDVVLVRALLQRRVDEQQLRGRRSGHHALQIEVGCVVLGVIAGEQRCMATLGVTPDHVLLRRVGPGEGLGRLDDVEGAVGLTVAGDVGMTTGRSHPLVVGGDHDVASVEQHVGHGGELVGFQRWGAPIGDARGAVGPGDDAAATGRCRSVGHGDEAGDGDAVALHRGRQVHDPAHRSVEASHRERLGLQDGSRFTGRKRIGNAVERGHPRSDHGARGGRAAGVRTGRARRGAQEESGGEQEGAEAPRCRHGVPSGRCGRDDTAAGPSGPGAGENRG